MLYFVMGQSLFSLSGLQARKGRCLRVTETLVIHIGAEKEPE